MSGYTGGKFGIGQMKGFPSSFNGFLGGGQFGPEVVPFSMDATELSVVSVVGGPTMLGAIGTLMEAAESAAQMARDAGQDALADSLLKALNAGIRTAVAELDESAVAISDPEDPLFVPAMERLAAQAK